jgi:hypothetical protein
VLPTVNLNNEVVIVANKIDDELPNQGLSPKAKTVQSVRAQFSPQLELGVGHLMTQRLCEASLFRSERAMRGLAGTPLPDRFAVRPPPQGGR